MIYSDPAAPYYAGVPEDALALRQAIREEYGFDRSVMYQYLIYLKRTARLDFGVSYIYKEPVFTVMFRRIPWSLVLSLSTLIISVTAGIFFGAHSALRRGRWQDRLLLGMSTASAAIPPFWLAMAGIMVMAFAFPLFPYRGAVTEGYTVTPDKLKFFCGIAAALTVTTVLYVIFRKKLILFAVPVAGLVISVLISVSPDDAADIAYHAFLPVLVTSAGSIISYAMLVRNSMISVVSSDYIITARAKGVPERDILFGHIFRNSLLPLITNIGLGMAGLIGGSVLIEQIFTWPGMGTLLLEANNNGDFQLSQAILMLFAVISVASNFLTDLVYSRFDPRIKVR